MADVVAGLLLRDGKALLGLRKPGKRGGLWEMPGGKVDERVITTDHGGIMEIARERHETALAREWMEELGYDIIVGERIATCVLDVEVVFTVTLYAVTFAGDDGREPQPLDHVELRWADLDEAIQNWPCSPAMYMHWPMVRAWLAQQHRAPSGRMR